MLHTLHQQTGEIDRGHKSTGGGKQNCNHDYERGKCGHLTPAQIAASFTFRLLGPSHGDPEGREGRVCRGASPGGATQLSRVHHWTLLHCQNTSRNDPCHRDLALRLNPIQRHHPHHHVFVDVAVIHPGTRVVGDHVGGLHLRLRQRHDICPMPAIRDNVSMPMRSVPVHCSTERDEIPAYPFSFFHRHQRAIGIHVSVDGGTQVFAAESTPDERERSVRCDRLTR